MGFFDKLKERVNKTRENFSTKVNSVIKNFRKVDEEFFEELEEALILSDIGYATTEKVIETLRDHILAEYMTAAPLEIVKPTVMLVVGVNGVGKTTAIGKLTNYYNKQGKKVLLAAADTFRAAAAEQLSIWGQRTDTRVIKYAEGADPAAVVYDAIDAAKHAGSDILIIDNLMGELEKINRVIDKEYPQANRETFLVVDATTGQNAISQTEVFNESVKLTGIILTKLDGTAKGGVVCAVKDMTGVPVRFIGVGEGAEDLQPFDAYDFAKAILE